MKSLGNIKTGKAAERGKEYPLTSGKMKAREPGGAKETKRILTSTPPPARPEPVTPKKQGVKPEPGPIVEKQPEKIYRVVVVKNETK